MFAGISDESAWPRVWYAVEDHAKDSSFSALSFRGGYRMSRELERGIGFSPENVSVQGTFMVAEYEAGLSALTTRMK